MKRLSTKSPQFYSRLARLGRSAGASEKIEAAVRSIIADVEKRGDRAISDCVARFDKAALRPSQFRVSKDQLRKAARGLPVKTRKAIRESIAAVTEFGRRTIPANWTMKNRHGATVGERFYPLKRVGIYVPGGKAPLVSTVIMTAGLAKAARVPEIAAFTPSNAEGEVSPEILAALHMVGVDEVYRVGGVQAIAAMALGTRTIQAVDKIFGPGSAYVVEAKRLLFGRVGIDLLPGPSEVMVIAGDEANPAFVAADLLSQAEHDSECPVYLVAFSKKMIDAVERQVEEQMGQLKRSAILKEAVKRGCVAIEATNIDEAIAIANFVAPEHLELHLPAKARATCIKKITTAGSILAGDFSPTVLGDFVAGPSHVLPTGRSGRFSSGLRASDFFRKTSLVEYNAASLKRALPAIEVFSEIEDLDAHGRSASIRFGE